jgi:hypothetical protein
MEIADALQLNGFYAQKGRDNVCVISHVNSGGEFKVGDIISSLYDASIEFISNEDIRRLLSTEKLENNYEV